jgi:ABC-type lipoprotein export system ATPase subunit
MTSSLLEAKNLSKTYSRDGKSVRVLKEASLTLHDGEMVVVAGPSGAGKTTLLNLLSGLDHADSGEVMYKMKSLQAMSPAEKGEYHNRSMGFIFQFYHLLGDLNAIENVMLPARIHSEASEIFLKKRATKLLEDIGLGHRLAHLPSELSGGEQQRVALARSVMNDPQILFCDEPTGNLDRDNAIKITDYLKRLVRDHHKTVLIVTHDDKIAGLADRVLRLNQGRFT